MTSISVSDTILVPDARTITAGSRVLLDELVKHGS